MQRQRIFPLTAVVAVALLAASGALALSGADTISTAAGNGVPGFSGDGGPATAAQLNDPNGVAVDAQGNLYIAEEFNNRVRKVSVAGRITTFAGTGVRGFSGDGGPATSATLFSPSAVAVDGQGNVYIADSGNHRVRRVSHGTITTIAGTGIAGFSGDGGPAALAKLNFPEALAIDAQGALYIADVLNHRVRKVSAGTITTIAGDGIPGFGGDGGRATAARLNAPFGVAVDAQSNVYIADMGNNRLREVSGGRITTIAGNGVEGSSGDNGPATEAAAVVQGVAVDAAGNVYIAGDQRVRKVSCGAISTIAGNGTLGDGGDDGPARSAVLNQPDGMAFDRQGNLYIADYGNARIRKIVPTPRRRPDICIGGVIQPNVPPTAAFSASPTSGEPPLSVTFDATRSRDPDGHITSYAWSFGDGTTGSGKAVTHTYKRLGAFTATLTVRDDAGASTKARRTIVVRITDTGRPRGGTR